MWRELFTGRRLVFLIDRVEMRRKVEDEKIWKMQKDGQEAEEEGQIEMGYRHRESRTARKEGRYMEI